MTFPILGGNSAVSADAQANSLRFNDNDSAYLSRTISSGSDITKFTYSFWVKRSTLGSNRRIISNTTSSKQLYIRFTNSDTFEAFHTAGGTGSSSYVFYLQTTAKFRDVSAWYHILIKFDSTQSTEADRTKIYVNGNQITDLEDNTQPSQNEVAQFINTGQRQDIGTYNQSSEYFDGYLAEFHFLDSISLTPTDFGEFDSTSGIWKVKEYTGSYGTNGYKLNFSDSGSLGADSSGNGNDFTASNLASTDQMLDSPTNNFCTMNPLDNYWANSTYSEGNCKMVTAGTGYGYPRGTIGVSSGKWYFEAKASDLSGNLFVGIASTTGTGTEQELGYKSNDYGYKFASGGAGSIRTAGSENAYGNSISTSDILGVAIDLDNNKLYFSKNGTFQNSGNPVSGTNGFSITAPSSTLFGAYFPSASDINSNNPSTVELNFGNPSFSISSGNSDGNGYGNFEYAPPSGYLALCTQNLATELSPTIDDGSDYFNTVLYTGNDSNGHGITGVGFQPDWTWIKARTDVRSHSLVDINRGAGKILSSHHTSAEYTDTTAFASFDSDGFTVGTDYAYINDNSHNYVAWNWLASNTTASNTDGSVTSTVSANTTAGFSIVTYTGDGGTDTIGHGLSKPPEVFIIKRRDAGSNWTFYTTGIDGTLDYLFLETTNASGNAGEPLPTSSVFTIPNIANTNASGGTYVTYCFHSVEGYSKIGSYTGNGSSDGTYIYTGFRPSFILMKSSTSAENWLIYDSKRDPYNVTDEALLPNSSSASGGSSNAMDLLSNGFKFRSSAGSLNGSGQTYLYMAFGHTFVDSNGNPNTAR